MPHQNWCLLLLKFICWINWWVITRGSLQSEIRCPCISPNLLASEDTWHALRIRLPAISLYGEDSHASPISNSDFYSVLNLWVIESSPERLLFMSILFNLTKEMQPGNTPLPVSLRIQISNFGIDQSHYILFLLKVDRTTK